MKSINEIKKNAGLIISEENNIPANKKKKLENIFKKMTPEDAEKLGKIVEKFKKKSDDSLEKFQKEVKSKFDGDKAEKWWMGSLDLDQMLLCMELYEVLKKRANKKE